MLLPSLWYENAPVTVIEAAAYGLGLVASRIGGIPEFVEDGSTGLLCEPGNVASLATAIAGLASGTRTLQDFEAKSAALAARSGIGSMTDSYLRQYVQLTSGATLTAPVTVGGSVSAL